MRISDLAAATGTTASTIRYYERIGLLPDPPRHPNGYRDYTPEAPARVQFIRAAQSAGLSLDEVAAILDLRDTGTAPCAHVTAALQSRVHRVDAQIAALQRHRRELRDILDRAATLDPARCEAYCQIIDPGT